MKRLISIQCDQGAIRRPKRSTIPHSPLAPIFILLLAPGGEDHREPITKLVKGNPTSRKPWRKEQQLEEAPSGRCFLVSTTALAEHLILQNIGDVAQRRRETETFHR
jgi:hypothetical protein